MAVKKDPLKIEEVSVEAVPGPEELVDYTAPFTTPDAKPITVIVNGECIRIQRGATVKIKRKYLDALIDANDQEMAAFMAQQAAEKASRQSLADL